MTHIYPKIFTFFQNRPCEWAKMRFAFFLIGCSLLAVQAIAQPTLVAPTNQNFELSSSVYFDWNSAAGSTESRIQVAAATTNFVNATGFTNPVYNQNTSSNTSATVQLEAGKSYAWAVKGTNSGYSNRRYFIVRHAAPSLIAPDDGVTITNDIGFSWDNVANADQYKLQISTLSNTNAGINDFTNPNIYDQNIGNQTRKSLPLSTFRTGVTYYWHVRGGSNIAGGIYSEIRSFTLTRPVDCSSLSANVTTTADNGASNGTATTTVNGGTAPYTFNWNNGQTASSISNLAAGQYCVTITDANACSANACGDVSVQVTPLSINADLTPATCQANGKAMISVTGGSGSGYQIRWSDGVTGVFERVNLAAGNYDLTVTDANPQVGQEVKTVTIEDQNQVPTVNIQQNIDPMSNLPTELFTNPDNFSTYRWLKNGLEVSTDARLPLGNLAAGSYTFKVVVRDNCQQEATAEINVTVTAQTLRLEGTAQATAATCPRNGVISIDMTTAPADVTFSWNDGQTGNPRTGLAAGTYAVTVSAPNYEALILNQIVVADDYTPLNFDIQQRNGTTANERIFSTNPANLGTIDWRIGSPTSAVLGTDAEFIHEFTVGTHTVLATITDACNETLTKEISVTIGGSSNELIVNSSITPETCRENGNGNGSIILQTTGGSGQNTVAWEGLTTTSTTLTGLLAGTYRYTVTDADPSVLTASGTLTIADERLTPFLQLQSVRETQPRTYTFSVTPTTDLVDFLWRINGTEISRNASFLHTFSTDGNYTINLVTAHRCGKMVEHQTVINVSTSGGGGTLSHSLICRNPEGIPTHTAIFDYQISGNASGILRFGDGQEQILTAQTGTLNHQFQYAGVYYAVLFVNNLPVDTATIIVTTGCGWSSYIGGIGFTGVATPPHCENVRDGIFHVEASRIAYGYYWTTLHRVQHFGVDGDNARFEVRANNSQSAGGISCFDLTIAISGTKSSAHVSLMTDWCSFYANLAAGRTARSQVPELARDLQAWHTYKLQTENHVVKVFYDGVLIYSMPYEGEIGEIVGISVNFKGTGSVDKVELKENGAATSAFMDDFSTCQNTQRSLVSVNDTTTICSGQTIIFNNQNLTQTGIYQDTIAGMGCVDTLKTLNLTVLPAVRTVQNFTIRQGDSLVINGRTHRTTGVFTDILRTVNGCDSLVETHLTVIACNLSVQIQKQGNTLRLSLQNAPPQYNVLWTLPNGQTRTSEVIEVTTSGIYSVKITDIFGCEAAAQIQAQREGYSLGGGSLQCGEQSFWLPFVMKKYDNDLAGLIATLRFDSTEFLPTGRTRLTSSTEDCLINSLRDGNKVDYLLYLNRANPIVGNVGDTLFLVEFKPVARFLRQNATATIQWVVNEDHFTTISESFNGSTTLRVEGATIVEFKIWTDGTRELTRDNNAANVLMGDTCNTVTERLVSDAARKSTKVNPMPFYQIKQSVCDVLDRQIETSQDIYLASQIAIGSRSFIPTEYQMFAADANKDGKVSAIDISLLQQRRIGLLDLGFLMPDGTRKTRLYFDKKRMAQQNWHVSRHYPDADTEGGMTRQNVPVIGDDCSKLDTLMRCDTFKVDIVEIRIGDLDGTMSVVLRSSGVLEIGCDKIVRNDTMFLAVTTPQYATSFDVFVSGKTPFIGIYEAENGVMKVKANVTNKVCNVSGYSSKGGGIAPKQILFYVAIPFTGDSTIPQFATDRALLNGQPATFKVVNSGCSTPKKLIVNTLRVYPNPTADLITVSYSVGFKGQLSLTDAIGRQIAAWKTDGTGNMSVDLTEFAPGVYVLKLSDGTFQKAVKQ